MPRKRGALAGPVGATRANSGVGWPVQRRRNPAPPGPMSGGRWHDRPGPAL